METIGFIFGLMGFVFALVALGSIKKLVTELKAKGVLGEDYQDKDLDGI